MSADNQIDDESRLHLVIDFESLDLDELAELLVAMRSIIFRALIRYLKEQDSLQSTSLLDMSYRKFIERRLKDATIYPDIFYDYRRKLHDYQFGKFDNEEPLLFDEWTRYLAKQYRLEIRSIELGSCDFSIYFASILYLLAPGGVEINYSMTKDFAAKAVQFVSEWTKRPRPKGHLEHIPDVVESIMANSGVTKLEIHSEGEKFDLKAEFEKRKKRKKK